MDETKRTDVIDLRYKINLSRLLITTADCFEMGFSTVSLGTMESSMKHSTEKLVVATELLNCALRLYYEGNSYFAALHLAGGAEEVLGAYVEHHIGGESSFKSLQRGAVNISKFVNGEGESKPKDIAMVMNNAKNSTKHMDSKDDNIVHCNPQTEAKDLLDRAISNYYYLMGFYNLSETDLVRRFNLESVGHSA